MPITNDQTSSDELQTQMDHPSPEFIRKYAFEVFGEPSRTERWLTGEILALGNSTPESLIGSNDDDKLRKVLRVLIQIDYGVVG